MASSSDALIRIPSSSHNVAMGCRVIRKPNFITYIIDVVYLSYFVYPNRKVPIKMCSDRRGYKAVCPDCKAYGLKKHGLTKSDCVLYIITLVNRVSPRLRSIPGQVVNPRPQRHLLSPTLSQKCIIMYMYMADSDDVIGIRLV